MVAVARSSNAWEDRRVRRALVVLGILCALALLVVTAFLAVDVDEPRPVDVSPPTPTVEPPPAPAPPQRAVKPPTAETPKPSRRRTPPVKPPALGRLFVDFSPAPSSDDSASRRATVLLPTGEELATDAAAGVNQACIFEGLPTDVPLVVRVDARGFLTGLCCDVVLLAGTTTVKRVDLIPAPTVAVRVVEMPRRRRMSGVRVELRRGGDVFAAGATDVDGLALMRVAGVGQFRVRLEAAGFPTPPEGVIDVWAGDDFVETELEMRAGGTVEVVVVTSSGAQARGVDVWLLGDSSTPPCARTDQYGVATFANVGSAVELTAVARADCGVARAKFNARDGALQRVPLLLKAQAPLVGDVVDEGGGAIAGASVEVVVRPFAEPVRVKSDASGHFSTPPLPAGLAEVFVRRDGFVEWSAERPVEIEPALGGYVRARLRRLPTGAVVVVVRDDSDRPLVDVGVTLYPSERTATTAADGTCRIDGLPAGVEQSVVARRSGYRTTRSAAAPPPVVRVRADFAEGADVVLSSIADPAPRGGLSATGVVLDPSSRPVVGARVEAGAVRGFTDADGGFVLEGLAPPKSGDALEIRVVSDRWTLEPFRCFVDVDPSGVAALGTVRLRSRPYALLHLPPPTASVSAQWNSDKSKAGRAKVRRRGGAPTSTYWLSYNHDDELLGRRTRRFDAFPCVSYDGTWLHLPPADDWKRDGRGEVFVAAPTARGLLSGGAVWTQTADAAATLKLSFASRPGNVVVFYGSDVTSERTATFRQIACAALFDPRSIHVPSGDEQRPVDPFASLVACRSFSVDDVKAGTSVDGLAPGRWRIDLDGVVATEATVPDEVRIYLER
jgi:hypothetical protein